MFLPVSRPRRKTINAIKLSLTKSKNIDFQKFEKTRKGHLKGGWTVKWYTFE